MIELDSCAGTWDATYTHQLSKLYKFGGRFGWYWFMVTMLSIQNFSAMADKWH